MAELRYITIPADVPAEDISPIDGEAWSWARCVEYVIHKDSRFNDNGEGIRAGAWILRQLKQVSDGKTVWLKKAGDELPIDQPYWRLLHEAMEKPLQHFLDPRWRCAYLPPVHLPVPQADGSIAHVPAECPPGVTFLSYIDAVSDDATKKKVLPETATRVASSAAGDQPS
jgi:hypothetical protein